MATSNETKMKGKVRVAEKPATPLFNVVKAENSVQNQTVADIIPAEEFPQMANPLPVEVKPRRGRQPKAKPTPEPEPVPNLVEEVPAPAPEKKRRGRPKKQPVVPEDTPVEKVVEELMPEKKRRKRKEYSLFTDEELGKVTPKFDEEPPIIDTEVAETAVEPENTAEVPAEKPEKPRRGRPKKKTTEKPEEQKEDKPARKKKKKEDGNLPEQNTAT